jgi:Prasinovirus endonuclease VII
MFPATPAYRIADNVRRKINRALAMVGKQKAAPTTRIIGCSIEFLFDHLESQFTKGMTRANYGTYWHIDHITPLSYFDCSDPRQLRQAFNWQNLRPLTAKRNQSEGNRRGHSQTVLPLSVA